MTEKKRNDEPTNALVLLALIRALHQEGILPAQAIAEVLDLRALNAERRGKPNEEDAPARRAAVILQQLADDLERKHPFPRKN